MKQNNEDLAGLFRSESIYQARFEAGLERLLEGADFNLFILVLANATCSGEVYDRLRDRLVSRFDALHGRLASALAEGVSPPVAEDDLLVFLKIVAIGFDALRLTEQRREGRWEVQFNQLRSFRPLRQAGRPVSQLKLPFDASGFHFNKPFMQQETICSGVMLGRSVDLYYNKFPFADYHALLVPERAAERPQFLEQDVHHYIWSLVDRLGETVPAVRIGYNATGAFASVNHLHFQLCVRSGPLPVEIPGWRHNGGDTDYPAGCETFRSAGEAWAFINRLHDRQQSYNVLYAPGKLYCLPRKRQGEAALPDWSPGFSWYEMCGGFITFNHELYRQLRAKTLSRALAALAIE